MCGFTTRKPDTQEIPQNDIIYQNLLLEWMFLPKKAGYSCNFFYAFQLLCAEHIQGRRICIRWSYTPATNKIHTHQTHFHSLNE